MRLIATAAQLLTALQTVASAIEKRHTLPILANVLLDAQDGELTLTGTDMEIQIVTRADGITMSHPGRLTVPAQKLLAITKTLREVELLLEETKDTHSVKIISGRSRFTLATLPAVNYPDFSANAAKSQITIKADTLKQALSKTAVCMANNDVRHYLNGLSLRVDGQNLTLAASDGHRLAVYAVMLSKTLAEPVAIIIPRKAVHEIIRLIADDEDDITLSLSDNTLQMHSGNTTFQAKLIDGKYPDFSRQINQDYRPALLADRQGLRDAVQRVALTADPKYRGILLDIDKNYLTLTSRNHEADSGEDGIAINNPGEPVKIGLNAHYLLDLLAALDDDQIRISVASNDGAVLLDETSPARYRYLVMPIRLCP